MRRSIRLTRPLDLPRTLRPIRRGGLDPTLRASADGTWRATRTPAGPATQRLRLEGPDCLDVEAWGPGAEWLLDAAPGLVGELDRDEDFVPRHPLLRDLRRLHPGLRIGRTDAVYEAAVATVLEQRVPSEEAWRGWHALVRELGEPAPGPLAGLWVPPAPERLAATPYFVLHGCGVERRRADTLRRVATYARRLEETSGMPAEAARRRLLAVPGLGPWSAAEIAHVALGDPDAVSVGDYHLPHLVTWALAGEPRGTDERMLELLDPYRGQRARVIRLLLAAGVKSPRRGPRLPLRNVAQM